MVDKPIPFLAPMVQALLGGRKTQDRWIVKTIYNPGGVIYDAAGGQMDYIEPYEKPERPKHAVGDRLWVREAWRTTNILDSIAPRDLRKSENETVDYTPIRYEVDGATKDYHPHSDPDFGRLRQAIHMPRWASRITLIVEDVKVERLQDISEDEALAEGVPDNNDYAGSFEKAYCRKCGGSSVHGALGGGYGVTEVDCTECETARMRYRNLWNLINGPGSWEANPWVSAYSFRCILQNIDEVR